MTPPLLQRPWLGLALTLAIVGAGLVGWSVLSPEAFRAWLSEEGPVETASAWLYFAAAPALWCLRGPTGPRLALAVVALAFGLRELEMHKAFTGTSMLRLSWYASDAPLLARMVAAAVLLTVLVALATLLLRGPAPLWRALRRGTAAAWTALTFLAVLVGAKLLDRSLNVLHDVFGIDWSPTAYALQAAVEEPSELALPLLMLLAVLQQRRSGEG